MAGQRGGEPVVVRVRESRTHGEGAQRIHARWNLQWEEFSVNTGEPPVWPEPYEAERRVLRMQAKLHQWAAGDPARRFDDLFNLVADPAFLVTAWERVWGNQGARTAGVDRVKPRFIRAEEMIPFLTGLREQLKTRAFRPLPVRQVMIPKGNGKLRALGIPTEPANCPVAQGS